MLGNRGSKEKAKYEYSIDRLSWKDTTVKAMRRIYLESSYKVVSGRYRREDWFLIMRAKMDSGAIEIISVDGVTRFFRRKND